MAPVSDRALQRSTAEVLSAIYAQEFLACSFGGRPGVGAHHAVATLNEVIAGGKIGWVLEADLKNFFGSLDQEWVLRFVEQRELRKGIDQRAVEQPVLGRLQSKAELTQPTV